MFTHYHTLDVTRSADLGAIKKAYYKISLLHHPDKTVHLPDTERAQREQLFKLANVAFEVLSGSQKRKAYDQNLRAGQAQSTTRTYNAARKPTARPQHGSTTDRQPPDDDCKPASSSPSKSPNAKPGEFQGFPSPQGIHRAPTSAHRFTASTLGKAPDFHWSHCQLNEYSSHATLTYNNWLGWNISVNIGSHFKVIAGPIIPPKPVLESITIRLPVQRKVSDIPHVTDDVAFDLRGVPGNKHTYMCSTLVESQAAGLEVVVEFAVAPAIAPAIAQGPVVWNWAYSIEHEPLAAGMIAKVTASLFYPYKPFIAVSPRETMPTPLYPEDSPMYRLLTQFPGIRIEEPASGTYLAKEEQQGKIMWRLTAVGSM